MNTLTLTQRLQLCQLENHKRLYSVWLIESLLADGETEAAIVEIGAAMKRLLKKLARKNPTSPTQVGPPLPAHSDLDPTSPADWDKLPRTAAESITAMLGGNHLAERERLAQPGKVSKPTPEQAQRGLEDALRPGGGRFNPVHRPKAQFGK